jgi:hypothetical protein
VAGTGQSRSRNRLVGDIGGALTKSGAPAVCPRAGQRSASPTATDPIAVLPPDRGRRPAHLKTAHDFDVLQFPDGSWHLMVSDWDAGWIDVDVIDPENPDHCGRFRLRGL